MVDVLFEEDKTFGNFSEQEEQKETKTKEAEMLRTIEGRHDLKESCFNIMMNNNN